MSWNDGTGAVGGGCSCDGATTCTSVESSSDGGGGGGGGSDMVDEMTAGRRERRVEATAIRIAIAIANCDFRIEFAKLKSV